MARLGLTTACGRYDRVWPLLDSRVQPEGIDLNIVTLDPEECFWRMIRFAEFDVSELSLASYAMLRARDDTRFIGIPVFLSRSFRHSSIYVRPDAGVGSPKDLEGRHVGVPEYQMTAAVWARGMLRDEFSVDTNRIVWRTGGLEQPGRTERQPLDVPPWVTVEPIASDQTLCGALDAGELDAIVAPRIPSSFRNGDRGIARLFPDYADRELDYYQRTGLFPIMHLVAIRSEVHQRHPWVAQSLYKAFSEAKRMALSGLTDAPALRYTMPFLLDALERQGSVFGDDPWPYGVEQNRATLEVFCRYLVEQGLVTAAPAVDSLFADSTLAGARI